MDNEQSAKADATNAWRQVDQLRTALVKATAQLIINRDCLYESVTTQDGDIPDEQDRDDLAEADALIDECQAALGGLSRVGVLAEAEGCSGQHSTMESQK